MNATKRFPGLKATAVAHRAKREKAHDLSSAANINAYLNKLSGVFNWALKEEIIKRNPAVGLKVPDTTPRRDKRSPFTPEQLHAIFRAPLYVGCRDDQHGYAMSGPNRPRNARFWLPLIGLYSGLRLNEACQLDVADVTLLDGVACFAVTASSLHDDTEKRLKTQASERVVPIHPVLLDLGFVQFVSARRSNGFVKLFPEIGMDATGYRSHLCRPGSGYKARLHGLHAPACGCFDLTRASGVSCL
ncbi:hypothetical protein [Sphingomonas sp. LHG3443-2]|uniref:hypothetical protein n=1 Tax=Sphingomonas sp. LHG3443-2 TaxID=2804639 RepID=UPI003CF49B35